MGSCQRAAIPEAFAFGTAIFRVDVEHHDTPPLPSPARTRRLTFQLVPGAASGLGWLAHDGLWRRGRKSLPFVASPSFRRSALSTE